MCRLTAYIGGPVSLRALVFGGSHSLFRQSWAPRELLSGTVNADGYGVAWYGEGGPARIGDDHPVWHAADLETTLGAIRASCAVAALRNATPGLPIDRSGVAPMVRGGWTFVLNGFVPDFRARHMRALRAELPDDLYATLEGSSDAETLFLLALAAIRGGASAPEALQRVARAVAARVGTEEAQLNMILTDGKTLVAARCGTVLLTNSLYMAVRPPSAPAGVLLASEALEPGAVWEPVDGHSWVEIAPDTTVRSDFIDLR